jgi:hypothetical protein
MRMIWANSCMILIRTSSLLQQSNSLAASQGSKSSSKSLSTASVLAAHQQQHDLGARYRAAFTNIINNKTTLNEFLEAGKVYDYIDFRSTQTAASILTDAAKSYTQYH